MSPRPTSAGPFRTCEPNAGRDTLRRHRRGIGAMMEHPTDASVEMDAGVDPDLGPDAGLDLELHADRLREECGVFGIYGHPDAAAITALGLHALQHRGQEAAGIVSYDGKRFHSERRLGLVGDTF